MAKVPNVDVALPHTGKAWRVANISRLFFQRKGTEGILKIDTGVFEFTEVGGHTIRLKTSQIEAIDINNIIAEGWLAVVTSSEKYLFTLYRPGWFNQHPGLGGTINRVLSNKQLKEAINQAFPQEIIMQRTEVRWARIVILGTLIPVVLVILLLFMARYYISTL